MLVVRQDDGGQVARLTVGGATLVPWLSVLRHVVYDVLLAGLSSLQNDPRLEAIPYCSQRRVGRTAVGMDHFQVPPRDKVNTMLIYVVNICTSLTWECPRGPCQRGGCCSHRRCYWWRWPESFSMWTCCSIPSQLIEI